MILWIGGSSCLARSYLNKYGVRSRNRTNEDAIILAGLEKSPPSWIPMDAKWIQCDLTSVASTKYMFKQLDRLNIASSIKTIIISVRAPLVYCVNSSNSNERHENLLVGIKTLMEEAVKDNNNVKSIIHISSVAAVNHLQEQCNIDESYDDDKAFPPISSYKNAYDIFKRKSEEIISQICDEASAKGEKKMAYTNLRISGIFSDSPSCIQCCVMNLFLYVSSYVPLCIDINSSANVSRAIRLILNRMDLIYDSSNSVAGGTSNNSNNNSSTIQKVYYYTRPTINPVPYGELIASYRKAHNVRGVWLPYALTRLFIAFINWLVWSKPFLLHHISSLLVSIDYLLQVSLLEHTFSNARFRNDFPEISNDEETMMEAFIKRKKRLSKHC